MFFFFYCADKIFNIFSINESTKKKKEFLEKNNKNKRTKRNPKITKKKLLDFKLKKMNIKFCRKKNYISLYLVLRNYYFNSAN